MELVIGDAPTPSLASQPFETVERKGLGHPDTICDLVAEAFSLRLCRFYRERFGIILHHNVDKALLWGGVARPEFGGGEVLEPIEIFLAGRATREFRGVRVPVEDLAEEACRDWLARHMGALDPVRHVRVHCLVRPGSADLVELFARQVETGVPLANDTSCGVGFAPLSPLERAVLGIERRLNGEAVKRAHPEIGEDVKVMGLRLDGRVSVTLACAMIGRHLTGLADYRDKTATAARLAAETASELCGGEVAVAVNAADRPEDGSVYLTVTGTSAESGDDGEVGRGNRANGLITPYRPMTMEAAAGKNPVNHVGKLYNIGAGRIAARLVEEIAEIAEASCCLVSRIGSPIDSPAVVHLALRTEGGVAAAALRARAEAVVADQIGGFGRLCDELVAGRVPVA